MTNITTEEQERLGEIRQGIDNLDAQIQQLITERAKLAQEVAHIKTQGGRVETVFYRPEREAQVLREVMSRNEGPLADAVMARLFREIMSACLALEQPIRVAYLGPEGTFSQAAAIKHFGLGAQSLAVPAIASVFQAVEQNRTDYGVVPVENSTEGAVNITQDLLLKTELKVCGEVNLAIHHALLTQATHLEQVKVVAAHAQALAQCREWLRHNLPWATQMPMESNAAAAVYAAEHPEAAAIASEQASHLYQLRVLANSIEDQPDNTTRFWIIARHASAPSGLDKTSIIFSMPNRPGALHEILGFFAEQNISLSRLTERPSKQAKWSYVFYADLEGHAEQEPLKSVLNKVAQRSSFYKLLGSFPVAPY
jgi:chorismate mutase/prephenate dehydratase